MEARTTDDAVRVALGRLPQGLSVRLRRIPVPEQAAVLEDAGVPVFRMGEDMDEEDIRALDKAIRYKDSKVQLVRLVLMARIKNDVQDPELAEEMTAHILNQHPLDSVHGVYEAQYQGKPFDALALAQEA
ncbi:hypothetical protein [Desulfobotulus sp.]|jgi:hypothetical protein|uniref:hypothetical protein n=1 Tax=Desulfobotulus sp. TaxID=1940337 RepID=UPI002A35DD81|nr:hypothetical protein [Desulfobotulus sp.]MDY0163073.1 hypothetical protein [Desulfobotulus sp.]